MLLPFVPLLHKDTVVLALYQGALVWEIGFEFGMTIEILMDVGSPR